MSLFVEGDDGRYDKYTEVHYQKAYMIEEIKTALQEAGMTYITAYNAMTKEDATEQAERIYIIAQENGK